MSRRIFIVLFSGLEFLKSLKIFQNLKEKGKMIELLYYKENIVLII